MGNRPRQNDEFFEARLRDKEIEQDLSKKILDSKVKDLETTKNYKNMGSASKYVGGEDSKTNAPEKLQFYKK